MPNTPAGSPLMAHVLARLDAMESGLSGASGLTSPLDIDDCQLWLDASQITGLVDDDPVPTWSDLSPNGFDATQADPDAQPLYKSTTMRGQPGVLFGSSPSDSFMELDGADIFKDLTGLTMAAVVGGSSGTILYASTDADPADVRVDWGPGSLFVSSPDGDTDSVAEGSAGDSGQCVFMAAWFVISPDAGGGSRLMLAADPGKMKFAHGGAGSMSGGASAAVQIGNDGAFADLTTFSGPMCEIVVYDRLLTERELRELREYLSTKWSVL